MKPFNENNARKGRPAILTSITQINYHVAVLANYTLLIISMPAFCSCDKADTFQHIEDARTRYIHIESTGGDSGCLDIFFFNDDKLKLLDSYQRLPAIPSGRIEASSRKGDKILFAIAGTSVDPTGIGSYDDLNRVSANLCNEDPASPMMTATAKIRAGDAAGDIVLEPLLSEISVNSICCDFHRKTYAGKRLEDVKIYLANARNMIPVTGDYSGGGSFINCGGLSEKDMDNPGLSALVQASLKSPVGENVVSPDIHLYCYPNEVEEESLGTPFTMLVIEGTLEGEKTYYPLIINPDPDDGSPGIGRNRSYAFDITICRRGVPSPDIPIEPGIVRCGLHVKEWNGKEERTIEF